MITDWVRLPEYARPVGNREPLYFDSNGHSLFGWLHRPPDSTPPASLGIVICKPFGYEAVCAHRSLRFFADAAAELGIPALRFDYSGTGDATDIDPDSNQIDAWTLDVVSAVNELRRLTGVRQVGLVGFRLGSLLAALAVKHSASVFGLACIAPVLNGARYLKELKMVRLAAALSTAKHPPGGAVVSPDTDGDSALEVNGFPLSAKTIASLREKEMRSLMWPPETQLLVVDGPTAPATRAWAGELQESGARIEFQVLPGIVEMMMTEPHFAQVPAAIVTVFQNWLTQLKNQSAKSSSPEEESPHDDTLAVERAIRFPGERGHPAQILTERPVMLRSGDASIFGIVTEPPSGDSRRRAVILLNVGAEHHIGSSRVYVTLARRWAQHGYTVLRLDLAGLGDSDTRTSRPDTEVFPPDALEDIHSAIDFVRERYEVREITLSGLCSGAYHALQAAIVGFPVDRLMLVNPLNFLWSAEMSADALQQSIDVARNLDFLRQRVFSSSIWRRVLTGQISPWRIIRIALQRPVLTVASKFRDLARALGIRLPRDLGSQLETLCERGIRVAFIFSKGEPGLDVLKLQAGSTVTKLGDQCQVYIVDSADHIFSHRRPRIMLENILSEQLYAIAHTRVKPKTVAPTR